MTGFAAVTAWVTLVALAPAAPPRPAPTVAGRNVRPDDLSAEGDLLARAAAIRDGRRKIPAAELMALLRDADPAIRMTAAGRVPQDADVKLVGVLLDLCADPDWWVREAASEKLWRVLGPRHVSLVPRCIGLLKSEWPEVRANVVLALANVRHESIVPAAAAMIDDPDAHVRPHALKAIGAQGGSAAAEIIVNALTRADPHSWTAWWGVDALTEMKATDALGKLTGCEIPRVRKRAVSALLKMGDLRAAPGALAIIADPGESIRTRKGYREKLLQAGYDKPIPELPDFTVAPVRTPAPTGKPPAAYLAERPWRPRLGLVDLGGGRVYLGWSVTGNPRRQYRLQRRRGDGAWETVVTTRIGSHVDAGAALGKAVSYRVGNGAGVTSRVVTVTPVAGAVEKPGLVSVIENSRHSIARRVPPPFWTSEKGLCRSLETAIGDLDNDGRIDIVIAQTGTRRKRAFSADGRLLWERPYTRGSLYTHPVRVAIADLDGDGRSEMVCFEEEGDRKWLIVCDGATGRIKHSLDAARFGRKGWERRDKVVLIDRTGCGREDTIVLTTNVYGHPQAIAFDAQLNHLWTHSAPGAFGHKARVIDLDGDGRDEMILGGDCISADGKLLWRLPPAAGGGHNDMADAMDVDPDRPGIEIAFAGCDANIAWATDWRGKLLWLRDTGHAQWLVAGRFGAGGRTGEVWVRPKKWRQMHRRISMAGKELGATPIRGPSARIDWDGDPANGHEVLFGGPLVYNPATGKTLLRMKTPGRMRVADVIGDSREEIILIRPWERRVEIYTNPTVNPNPRPDRWDVGWWRYRSGEMKPYGRDYINPPS